MAAIFDPFGNAVHTALTFPVLGEDVLITGAGPIGIMAAIVARHAGARYIVITDVSDYRLELARSVGLTLALDVSRTRIADAMGELGMREGFDVGLEVSGRASALQEMLANMAHGGKIAMLGLPERGIRDRLVPPGDEHDHDQGHLRPGDVRNLVLDVRARPFGRRHLPGDHPQVRRHRLRGGLRGHGHRALRQGRAHLVRSLIGGPPCSRKSATSSAAQLEEIRSEGLFKPERVIVTPQQATVKVSDGREVLNLCANNYLGLADDPRVVAAAKEALDRWGYGMASVRFICGTQEVHKELERRLSGFLGTEDSILYSSCFDANGGLFETLLGKDDAVISDELNHASIIDGIRLCSARRYRYHNRDMAHLEEQLQQASDARRRLIATDGVFSMDGYVSPLREICDLADRYDAMVMVDDSHAVGFIGEHGRGTPELHGVADRVDIVTGTLGKALGGASGGVRERPPRDRRPLAPAVSALLVLQLRRPDDRGRLSGRARPVGPERRPAGQAQGEHGLVPGADDRSRLRHPPGRPPDRPGDVR